VNPQAVNEPGFDVFTANKRSVLTIKHTTPSGRDVDVALVAIGAMLVGSIVWTGGRTPGQPIARGQELGYFAYGGSTVIAVFPPGVCALDADLLAASEKEQPVETLVKVGYSLGRPVAA
jgi:phosphatidylserine decarboxylase